MIPNWMQFAMNDGTTSTWEAFASGLVVVSDPGGSENNGARIGRAEVVEKYTINWSVTISWWEECVGQDRLFQIHNIFSNYLLYIIFHADPWVWLWLLIYYVKKYVYINSTWHIMFLITKDHLNDDKWPCRYFASITNRSMGLEQRRQMHNSTSIKGRHQR